MTDWFRSWHGAPFPSTTARTLWQEAAAEASARYSCYPDWSAAGAKIGLSRDQFLDAFEELLDCGVISPDAFSSTIMAFEELWLLGRRGRPLAFEWARTRSRIFARDDFTCRYCGARGGSLECDHVVPVAKGGSHDDDNLAAACLPCNRSKAAKSLQDWRR